MLYHFCTITPFKQRFCSVVLLLSLLAAAGCYNQDQVRSYTVNKVADVEAQPASQGTSQRMLAAIMLPGGGDAWFFKLTGPTGPVGKVEADVRSMVESVTFRGGQPQWNAPDAWKVQPGNQIRYATLLIPNEGKAPLELSITKLPHVESETYVLDNVNRWRGQLNQASLTLPKLGDEVESFEVNSVPTTWVDISGTASAGGMRAPFMAGGGAKPPVAESLTKEPATTQVPPEEPIEPTELAQPMVGPVRPPVRVDSGGMSFDKPASWTEKEGSAFRKLAFDVKGDSGTGEVTVIKLGAAAGGMLANVNRWRGQVKLEPLAADQLDAAVEQIKVGKEEGQLVELIGTQQGILGAIVPRADATWFIKFTGDATLAKAQSKNFKAFLKSLELE